MVSSQYPYALDVLRSGLIIEVSAAEPATGEWRRQLDPQAVLGVPPHLTVLYPFVAPDQIDATTITAVERALAPVRSFDFELARIDWFGDRSVLWLAPDPVEPFQQITAALAQAFPEYPPYGGEFDGLTPHLTVATRGTSSELRRAEDELRQTLPIRAAADAVTLMVELPDRRWQRRQVFALTGR